MLSHRKLKPFLKLCLLLTLRISFTLQSNFHCLFLKFLLVVTPLTVLSNSLVLILKYMYHIKYLFNNNNFVIIIDDTASIC